MTRPTSLKCHGEESGLELQSVCLQNHPLVTCEGQSPLMDEQGVQAEGRRTSEVEGTAFARRWKWPQSCLVVMPTPSPQCQHPATSTQSEDKSDQSRSISRALTLCQARHQAPRKEQDTIGLALKKLNHVVEEKDMQANKSLGTSGILLPAWIGAKSKFSPGRCWGRLCDGTGI